MIEKKSTLSNSKERPGYAVFVGIFLLLYTGIYLPHFLIANQLEFGLIADFAVHALVPIFIIQALYVFDGSAVHDMAAELKWSWVGMLLSILLGIASAYILVIGIAETEQIFGFYNKDQINVPQIVIIKFNALGAFYLALTAGLFEEWLFKPMLIRCFRSTPNPFIFVTTSAVLFGATHYWQGLGAVLVVTLVYGLPTAIYYVKKRSILNLVILHVVADILVFGWAWRTLIDNGQIG